MVTVSTEREEGGRRWGKVGRQENYYKRVTGEGKWGESQKETPCLRKSALISPKYRRRNCTPDSPPCIQGRSTIYLHCSLRVIRALSPEHRSAGFVLHIITCPLSILVFALIWLPENVPFASHGQHSVYFILRHLSCSRLFHYLAFRISGLNQ